MYIFYNILKYTIIPSFTKRFEVIVVATFGKNLNFQCQNRATLHMTLLSRKEQGRGQHALFL